MFSARGRAALRAVTALARRRAGPRIPPVRIRDLARDASVPPAFLSKVIADLAVAGVVRTRKGPGGGVRLARPADEILLGEVIEAVERIDGLRRCVLEDAPCREMRSCPMHRICASIRHGIMERTTVKDAAAAYTRCRRTAKGARR